MKHIVFCWEFGEGYGHISGFLPIAQNLKRCGIKVSWVVRHLDFAHLIKQNLGDDTIILQAPCTRNTNTKREATLNYSHIISFLGYSNSNLLINLVSAWRSLMQILSADLIIADHSPTALIAAHTLGIKSCMIGTGFFSPPRLPVLPQFSIFTQADAEKLQSIDTNVVKTINACLQHFGQTPIETVAQIFTVEEDFLCTFPELDHYPQRQSNNYWGARFANQLGKSHKFSTDKFKVFVYLHANTNNFSLLMAELNRLPIETLAHIPKQDVTQLQALYSNIEFSQEPVMLSSIADEVNLIICNAGHGTVAAALLAGVRLLMIPNQLEQRILAQLLVSRGLCAQLSPESDQQTIERAMNFMLADTNIQTLAQAFSQHYAGFTAELHTEEITQRCLEIITGIE